MECGTKAFPQRFRLSFLLDSRLIGILNTFFERLTSLGRALGRNGLVDWNGEKKKKKKKQETIQIPNPH